MRTALQRRLTPILPVLAVVVSASIVSWEYGRRSRLASELVRTEREFHRLESLRSPNQPSQLGRFEHDVNPRRD